MGHVQGIEIDEVNFPVATCGAGIATRDRIVAGRPVDLLGADQDVRIAVTVEVEVPGDGDAYAVVRRLALEDDVRLDELAGR